MKRKILLLAIILSIAVIFLTACTDNLDNGKQPTGIAIAEFTETEYYLGQQLNLGNAQIVVSYADGWSRRINITPEMISGYNPKVEGKQTVTITHLGFTTQVEVNVYPLTIQSIDAVEVNPTTGKVTIARPLRVVEGGQPDYSTINLRVNYESFPVINEFILPSMVSGYSPEACPPREEPYPVTITYGGKTTTILIYVIEKSVQQLLVEKDGMPHKQQYFYNNPAFENKIATYNHGKPGKDSISITKGQRFTEVFDPAGLKITVLYNNGTKEVVPYSEIDSEDINFSYSFNRASAESPVTITYLNKQVIIKVKVIEPVTTGMEITTMPSTRGRYSFVSQDAALAQPQGTVVELPQYSPSDATKQYIIRTAQSDITAGYMVEGDTIEWNTGRATVIYDDRTMLTNVPLDFNDIVKTCDGFPALNNALNKTGIFTIKVSYSNSNWTPREIGITIVPRAAIKMFLAQNGVSKVLNRNYYVGDEIAPELIRYNVFYDNGTFLFGDMSYAEWIDKNNWQNGTNNAGTISYEVWSDPTNWSIDINQNVSYNFAKSEGNGYGWDFLTTDMLAEENSEKCLQPGNHSIRFAVNGVLSEQITVDVLPVIPVSISLIQDYSYYFSVGDSTRGFFENILRNEVRSFVRYNNGSYSQSSLSSESVDIYKDDVHLFSFVSSEPYIFTEAGNYQLRVSVDGASASLPLFVNDPIADPILYSITLASVPSSVMFDQFSNFQNALQDFRFTLTFAGGTQKSLFIGDGVTEGNNVYARAKYSGESRTEDDVLILCDQNRVGNQEVTFRYRGVSIKYAITIIGRWEKSIQIISLPKQFYFYGLDSTISLDGLKVRILYNDDTVVEETDFSDPKWSFILPHLGLVQDQHYAQKTVTVVLNGVHQKLKRDYSIEVADGEITSIEYDENQQIIVGYNGNTPIYESLLKDQTDYDGIPRKMLNVTYGEDLDLTSFILIVNFKYTDRFGVVRTAAQQRNITAANINYDKTVDYRDNQGNIIYTRMLTIRYCGKTVPIWLHLDVQRELVGIEIIEAPNQKYYTVGQNIDLRGGLIKRIYLMGDGSYSYDYIYMTNPQISVIYNNGAFPIGSQINFEYRDVMITYLGYSDSFRVQTYKKLNANLEYVDTVFRYGQSTQPKVTVLPSGIPGFEVPSITWSYGVTQIVNGVSTTVWLTECPSIPGTYPIKVTVHANEYYEANQEVSRNLNIMKKLITINGKDFTKYYSEADPDFNKPNPNNASEKGYYFFGYSGNDTPLVGNDIIQIRLLRKGAEAGQNVRYDTSGAILGYTIDYEIVSGNNQNDYYIIEFNPGKLIINPLSIIGSITFTGYEGLKADGTEHGITAYYLDSSNYKVLIDQKDIVYTYIDNEGNIKVVQKEVTIDGKIVMVNCPPSLAGTYTATISSNFTISGDKSVAFIINP